MKKRSVIAGALSAAAGLVMLVTPAAQAATPAETDDEMSAATVYRDYHVENGTSRAITVVDSFTTYGWGQKWPISGRNTRPGDTHVFDTTYYWFYDNESSVTYEVENGTRITFYVYADPVLGIAMMSGCQIFDSVGTPIGERTSDGGAQSYQYTCENVGSGPGTRYMRIGER